MWDFGGLAGPYYQWTRKVNGKTMTRLLSAAQMARYRGWFENAKLVRSLTSELESLSLDIAESGYPPWPAEWQQWRRWRENGVWRRAMAQLATLVRVQHGRHPIHSMVMIDAQTVNGGRAGPTFHNAGGRGGRTIGTKRSILVEILGLPIAARVDPARPHGVRVGRELLDERLADLHASRRSWPIAAIGASPSSPPARA